MAIWTFSLTIDCRLDCVRFLVHARPNDPGYYPLMYQWFTMIITHDLKPACRSMPVYPICRPIRSASFWRDENRNRKHRAKVDSFRRHVISQYMSLSSSESPLRPSLQPTQPEEEVSKQNARPLGSSHSVRCVHRWGNRDPSSR